MIAAERDGRAPADHPGTGSGGARDRQVLYATAFLRAVATGLMGVLLRPYLARLEFSAFAVGLAIGAGLTGAGVSALIITFFGDRLGCRRALLILAVLATVGGAALAFAIHVAALPAAAFLGMVNGAGRDRAPALVLEQAVAANHEPRAAHAGVCLVQRPAGHRSRHRWLARGAADAAAHGRR